MARKKSAATADAKHGHGRNGLGPAAVGRDDGTGSRLAAYRHAGAGSGKKVARRFALDAIDPGARPFSSGDKVADKAAIEALAGELDRLQDRFHADRRYKLLVILQGTDTSGKDGTIRHVFGRTSALGVRAVSYQTPSAEERSHDFLWRIHRQVPAAGEVAIFNRSHYEDVLVPRVTGTVDADEIERRYAQINDFERMLAENGTVFCKFMLHISKGEQARRLQARLDDPTKVWKLADDDLEARARWDDYQRAYADTLAATGTPWAPWTVVPADSKTHRNLMIGLAMKEAFERLDLRYPPPDPALAHMRVN